MATTRIDELNILRPEGQGEKYGERYIPYEQYFGEMGIPEEKVEERIRAANDFEDMMMFVLALVLAMTEFGDEGTDRDFIENQIRTEYKKRVQNMLSIGTLDDALNEPGGIADILDKYIEKFAKSVLKTTLDRKDDPYFTSPERAKYIAENESNVVMNCKDFMEAVMAGATEKTWETMKDEIVRKTHQKVDGVRIPIGEYFNVGAARLMFPKDVSFGNGSSHPEEIINCRCWVIYHK